MKSKEVTEPLRPVLPNFIATNLRLLRNREGWSQSELAQKVYLNRGNIASYESGSAEPSICKLLRFSNLFGLNARDLTRRDLSNPEELALAQITHDLNSLEESERIIHFNKRAEELEELLKSSRKLFEYKQKNLESPCKEAELMAAQYLQLYEVSQQLLSEHQSLLNEVRMPCKQDNLSESDVLSQA